MSNLFNKKYKVAGVAAAIVLVGMAGAGIAYASKSHDDRTSRQSDPKQTAAASKMKASIENHTFTIAKASELKRVNSALHHARMTASTTIGKPRHTGPMTSEQLTAQQTHTGESSPEITQLKALRTKIQADTTMDTLKVDADAVTSIIDPVAQ